MIRTALLLLPVLGLGACSGMQIKYQPSPAPAPAATSALAVKVIDSRPPDKQQNKGEVAQIRGSFGMGFRAQLRSYLLCALALLICAPAAGARVPLSLFVA